MSKIVEKFKHTLKDLMEQKGIGVVELAKDLNTSRFVVHKWLTQAKDMRFDSLLKLANYFNCSIEYLCGRTDVYLGYVPKEPPKFSDRLREVLAEHGVTSYRLFKDTKIMATHLHQWKYNHNPMLSNLEIIADYLGVTIDYLIGRDT